jgi:penicillin-binding protein 1C
MSLRAALQQSRNIPAVAVLDAVGPAQMLARLRRAGVEPRLPGGQAPGLAHRAGRDRGEPARSGGGLRRDRRAAGRRWRCSDVPGPVREGARVLSARAAWQVATC